MLVKNLLDVFRPKRWYRNLMMIIGVLIAVKVLNLDISQTFGGTNSWTFVAALVSLCLIASANYGINEVLDAPFDAKHPQKKHRAIPSGRISAKLVVWISIGLYILGMAVVALTTKWPLIASVFLLLLSGIVYNIPPIRLKDRAYVDFTTEALNNAIRLMIGWYVIASSSQWVPASFVLAYWFIGVFLMASKRFGEIRLIGDRKAAGEYRRSLAHYDEEHLLMSMIGALAACYFMVGFLCFKYSVDIVIVLPFMVGWVIWFFKLAFEDNTIVKDPERIFEKKGFLSYSLLTGILFAYFFFSGSQFLNWIK
ncbi:MAG TPA: UbiA family prenyltransferase [Candidatus Saccharimonadales bacterium]|nr:UbiA family prenyltransferase [Candidatus Saccharimonadales bacterium]